MVATSRVPGVYDESAPEYVRLLHRAWVEANEPTARGMRDVIGYSATQINHVLNGRTLPSRALLSTLANHLCRSDQQREEILAHFDAYRVELRGGDPGVRPAIQEQARHEVQVLTEVIREGLADIAAAIRESKGEED